ncbi:MAG: DUF5103 domain-containing protein [Bacteroidetes bacterium]|nr:DUF5103 domain-containing protein [Bacteroidota bacterium]
MLKRFLLLFALLPVFVFSQNEEDDYVNDNVLKYDDYVYKPNIRTVQFHESTWEYAAPLIELDGDKQIELSFDDLNADGTQYSISFIHCNADWTPSDLMESEYMQGFFDLNIINYSFSQATTQNYAHYSILFPQQNMRFTKSGNYLLYVYANHDKKELVLTRRFMLFDNKINVNATFRQTIGGDDQFKKQQIDFVISSVGYDINNPQRDMKVVLVQNNRWDNAATGIQPTFISANKFTYSLDEKSTFNGGNEFRYFDIRSTRFLTERVESIFRDDELKFHAVLLPDQLRAAKPYLFYNDFNGNFLIKNSELRGDPDLEADYAFVDFFMPYPTPETQGNFYVMGKLTDWRMNKASKMTYDYKRMGYKTTLYLKQGYYNYMYVLSSDTKKGGDETLTEGSFWDTENDYNIYVYHRKFGTYYDQLIGVKKLNSLKK